MNTATNLIWARPVAALFDVQLQHWPGAACGCRWDEVCPQRRAIHAALGDLVEWPEL